MKKNNKNNGLPFSTFTLLIPIFLALISSLVVYGYAYVVPDSFQSVSTSSQGIVGDVFLHGKSILVYCSAIIAVFFMLCFKLLNRKILYTNTFMIFGGIYILGSGISAILAVDRSVSFFGGEEMFQGFWAIASYAVLLYYSYLLMRAEEERRENLIKVFLRGVLVLSFIFCLIGAFQFVGNDPFSWKWIQSLCNMKGASIVEDKRIYLTLYNSNYVGVISILIIPLLATGIIFDKVKAMKVLFVIATIGMIGCLIASGSKSAMICLAILAVIAFLVWGIISQNKTKIFVVIGIVIGVVFIVAIVLYLGKIISQGKFDSFASNRGYIWSRTIPLLPKRILVGSGMSHFALDFPNLDHASKAMINQASTIYNKPHNWYLQGAVESGVIALVGLVTMIAKILIDVSKTIKEALIKERMIVIGCGLSIIGFCLMGVFNDMMIMTAPTLFVCIGIMAGVCYNYKISKRKK